MSKVNGWDSRIGRRIRLRDLHVLLAVVQCGSMGKAGRQLGVSQSAISQMIADLEHSVGVRLLDRGPRGIEPTVYASALITHAKAAFDELRQGIQELEFLTNPDVGEVRIGCPDSVLSGIVPAIVQQFSKQHPKVVLEVENVTGATMSASKLRDRSLDIVVTRSGRDLAKLYAASDIHVEPLLDDQLIVAASAESRWVRRRKIDVAELAQADWIMPPRGFPNELLVEAFRAWGLDRPKIVIKTFSIHLRANMAAVGPFLTVVPKSALDFYGHQLSLKALPVYLPAQPWPIALVRLKHRTLSTAVARFIDCAVAFAKTIGSRPPQMTRRKITLLSDHRALTLK